MIEASCHCGAVRFEIDDAPATVTECTCSICRRYGVLWAYYLPSQVKRMGETDSYAWGVRSIDFHRCKTCGCVTHWSASAVDPTRDRMGVNARLMDLEVLAKARVRHLDGAKTETYLD